MSLNMMATILLGMSQLTTQADAPDPSVQKSVKKREQIQVLPVTRTPESDSAKLFVTRPKSGENINDQPIWGQFRVQWYSLGAGSSQFSRADEVAVSDMGQTVHVVVDNQPYFTVSETAIDPFNELGDYRITYYKFTFPNTLTDGPHTLRLFLTRSYGESLKGPHTYQALNFFIGKSGDNATSAVDLTRPYLTYNEPSSELPLTWNKPILLDFFLSNCELSPDGYKVRLSIDGQTHRQISSWQPYYIYGLAMGQHSIRLELLDEKGALVPGPFNDVTRMITVQ